MRNLAGPEISGFCKQDLGYQYMVVKFRMGNGAKKMGGA